MSGSGLFDLEGKVAIVTGGGSGIGRQMAHGLAEAGAELALCARKVERCEEAAAEMPTRALALPCDVRDRDSVGAMVARVVHEFGRIDILVNNAGTVWGDSPEDIPVEGWQKVVDVNLTGVFLCAQAAGRVMIDQHGGKIVNIASVAGLHGAPAEVMNSLPYHATKGAVIALTRDLAWKWARHGINVNAIAPGWFPSAMANFVLERNPALKERIPLGRFGGPDDLKGAVVFLASRASDFVTGHTLVVDGGQSGVKEELAERLGSEVVSLRQLAGGASKEAWAVDLADGRELLVRRAGVGVIHRDTLTLEQEFRVLEAAVAAGVRAPRPVAYLGDVRGHEAFAMERVEGETIGRRLVRDPPPGLALELAEELAKIHAIGIEQLDFLPRGDAIARFYDELDSVGEPHPAIEYGLAWVRDRVGSARPSTFVHADFRVGNLAVTDHLVAVLDWEFAHVGDPVEDVAWPLVRAWRFGEDALRLGGIGDVEPYLERYNELTGRGITLDELLVWEVFGNVKWAIGCLTQSRRHLNGQDRSVEYAVLGRMAAEMEYELLDLIERSPDMSDRPDAAELVEAVAEFLAEEVLPNAPDHRAKFRTLVAMNALAIARRELEADAEFPSQDELRELALRIRAGGPADAAALKEHVAAKLRISNPAHLQKYE